LMSTGVGASRGLRDFRAAPFGGPDPQVAAARIPRRRGITRLGAQPEQPHAAGIEWQRQPDQCRALSSCARASTASVPSRTWRCAGRPVSPPAGSKSRVISRWLRPSGFTAISGSRSAPRKMAGPSRSKAAPVRAQQDTVLRVECVPRSFDPGWIPEKADLVDRPGDHTDQRPLPASCSPRERETREHVTSVSPSRRRTVGKRRWHHTDMRCSSSRNKASPW
jgi:hypothetical protein